MLNKRTVRQNSSGVKRILTRLLVCDECGWLYKYKIQNHTEYWVCSHNGKDGYECHGPNIPQKSIYSAFVQMYNKLRQFEHEVLDAALVMFRELRKKLLAENSEIRQIDIEIAKLCEQNSRYEKYRGRGIMDEISYREQTDKLGVYFEEQAIDSLKAENETLIGLFSVIAQAESENIGANVRWGIRQSMKSGTYRTNFNCFGYRRGDDGVPVIVPEEASTVRVIFDQFLNGMSYIMIARYLMEHGYKTYKGNLTWTQASIKDILTNEKYVGDLLLQKTYIEDTISKKSRVNNGELAKYLITNNHPAIIDRDTFARAQAEIASRSNRRKKSEFGITELGKYSAKYALSDVLICGCCGSHYRRTGKNVYGKMKYTWRCIGRMEHRCTDAVGVEENRLHKAICRCLSNMMSNREAVVSLCSVNLKYAITGEAKTLDAYAIESQISSYQDEIDVLMEQEEKTGGDPDRYEKAIVSLYEKIGILREQLNLAQKQAGVNETVNSEVDRFLKAIDEYGNEDFTEFNDIVIRRLVECIRVMPDRSIEVVLKGGMTDKIAVE